MRETNKLSLKKGNNREIPPELKEVTLKYRLDLLRISQQAKKLIEIKKLNLAKLSTSFTGIQNSINYEDEANKDITKLTKSRLNKVNQSINQVDSAQILLKEDMFEASLSKDQAITRIQRLSRDSKKKENVKLISPMMNKKLSLQEKQKYKFNDINNINCTNKQSTEGIMNILNKSNKKKGIVLYDHNLSKERLKNLNEMRKYQVFGKGKKFANHFFVNKKIIRENFKLNNTLGSPIVRNENDDILRVIINNEEQLIKKFLIPKENRTETSSNEAKRPFKIRRNGMINLQEVLNGKFFSNLFNKTEDILQTSICDSSLLNILENVSFPVKLEKFI